MVVVAYRCTNKTFHCQLTCAYLPGLLCHALLRVTVHSLDSVLCPLFELFQQFHSACFVSGYWSRYALCPPQTFLVSALPSHGSVTGYRCWTQPLRLAYQFDPGTLLRSWGSTECTSRKFYRPAHYLWTGDCRFYPFSPLFWSAVHTGRASYCIYL